MQSASNSLRPPASYSIGPLDSIRGALHLIDRMGLQFKDTFKRRHGVDLLVATQFGTPPAKDTYSVSIRLADPTNEDLQWEARWFQAAAQAILNPTVPPS